MDNRLVPDSRGMVGTGVRFDRIRRITGYLVGTTDRWNNGKLAELRDRQKSKLKCQIPRWTALTAACRGIFCVTSTIKYFFRKSKKLKKIR